MTRNDLIFLKLVNVLTFFVVQRFPVVQSFYLLIYVDQNCAGHLVVLLQSVMPLHLFFSAFKKSRPVLIIKTMPGLSVVLF